MNAQSDQQLLRDYAERRSEAAFAELVGRHLGLVYSAALRMVCDPHLAQDVSQGVFSALAQNAPQLTGHPLLCGWLHRTTRNLASKTVRAELARHGREEQAAAMTQLLSAESAAPWDQVAPHLDAALDQLSQADRHALLLRYFQSQSARQMAHSLGVSEEAAQKRVSRAIERLRGHLSRQGVAAGAGGLALALSAHAVQAVPAGLAQAISSAALAGGALNLSTALAATKVLAMTTTQKAVLSILTAVALGAGLYEARQVSLLRRQVQTLHPQQSQLANQLSQAQLQQAQARERLAAAERENQRLKANQPVAEVLKGRGEVARWRSAATDSEAAAIKASLDKVESLKQRLDQSPEARIPELALLTEKDWFNMAKGDLNSAESYRWAFAGLRHAAQQSFTPLLQGAMRGYLYANQSRPPTNLAQLLPFFKPPLEPAMLEGWQIVRWEDYAKGGGLGDGSELTVTQKSAVDKEREGRVFLTPYGNRWEAWSTTEPATPPHEPLV